MAIVGGVSEIKGNQNSLALPEGIIELKGNERSSRVRGGITEIKANDISLKIYGLARYAVDQHNTKENTLLEFKKLVKAKQQVVAGMLYYLTLEVANGGKNELYEVKILDPPGLDSKKVVEEFKLIGDASSVSSA